MTTRAVLADYLPRWWGLYEEATTACQDAAGEPFSLPVYLVACDERAAVGRVLEAGHPRHLLVADTHDQGALT